MQRPPVHRSITDSRAAGAAASAAAAPLLQCAPAPHDAPRSQLPQQQQRPSSVAPQPCLPALSPRSCAPRVANSPQGPHPVGQAEGAAAEAPGLSVPAPAAPAASAEHGDLLLSAAVYGENERACQESAACPPVSGGRVTAAEAGGGVIHLILVPRPVPLQQIRACAHSPSGALGSVPLRFTAGPPGTGAAVASAALGTLLQQQQQQLQAADGSPLQATAQPPGLGVP